MDFDFDLMDILLWVVLPGFVIGAGVFLFVKLYKPKREEAPLYFRCPGCTRKIRYYKRQVGHRGMCSHCKTQWQFPQPLVRRST
jgi:hypothetical protein